MPLRGSVRVDGPAGDVLESHSGTLIGAGTRHRIEAEDPSLTILYVEPMAPIGSRLAAAASAGPAAVAEAGASVVVPA